MWNGTCAALVVGVTEKNGMGLWSVSQGVLGKWKNSDPSAWNQSISPPLCAHADKGRLVYRRTAEGKNPLAKAKKRLVKGRNAW